MHDELRTNEEGETGAQEAALASTDKSLAGVRLVLLAFGTAIVPLMIAQQRINIWLALGVLAVAWPIALWSFRETPWRKRRWLASPAVLFGMETLIVAVWIHATGGWESPFFVVFYALAAACAFQFPLRTALLGAAGYALSYIIVVGIDQALLANPVRVAVHVGYIFIAGFLGHVMLRAYGREAATKAKLAERLRHQEEIREREAMLAEAQSVAHFGSWTWYLDDDHVEWSAELYRIFGVTPESFVPHYESYSKMLHPADRDMVADRLRTAISERGIFQSDHRVLRPDGTVRWLHARGRLVMDEAGNPVRMVGTSQDITERKEMQSRLMIADRAVSLGTLAGGVAHEINNPLTFVLANVNHVRQQLERLAARHDEDLSELGEVVDETREGLERIRRIVKDLKTFSRGEEETTGPVDVHEVVELSVKMAMNEIRHRAHLVRDFGEIPAAIANDARLSQVLVNLLVNAAQAIPVGRCDENEIRIVTRQRDDRVLIEVHDTGSGIKPEIRDRIFEPFVTTKPVGTGTGLGLSVCRGIILSFGGEIEVESTVGVGSVFRVVLPRAEERVGVEPSRPEFVTLRPGSILVVDDEPLTCKTIERLLGRDHHVVTCTSGREALALLSDDKHYFDLVVCDLLMPDLTGIDVYETIKRSRPDYAGRMLFLSGGAFTASSRQFLAQMPNRFLEKPFDPEALRNLVRERLKS